MRRVACKNPAEAIRSRATGSSLVRHTYICIYSYYALFAACPRRIKHRLYTRTNECTKTDYIGSDYPDIMRSFSAVVYHHISPETPRSPPITAIGGNRKPICVRRRCPSSTLHTHTHARCYCNQFGSDKNITNNRIAYYDEYRIYIISYARVDRYDGPACSGETHALQVFLAAAGSTCNMHETDGNNVIHLYIASV